MNSQKEMENICLQNSVESPVRLCIQMFKKKTVIPIIDVGCNTSVQDLCPILIASMAAST